MPENFFDSVLQEGGNYFDSALQPELDPKEIERRATTGSFGPRVAGAWKTIAQHGTDNGFTVVAGYDPTGKKHNVNSQHYTGDAVDFRTKDKKPEEVDAFIANMKSRGFYVRDERTKPAGQKVWGGPHIHVAVPRGVPLLEAAREANPVLDAMMSPQPKKTPQKPVQGPQKPSPTIFDSAFQQPAQPANVFDQILKPQVPAKPKLSWAEQVRNDLNRQGDAAMLKRKRAELQAMRDDAVRKGDGRAYADATRRLRSLGVDAMADMPENAQEQYFASEGGTILPGRGIEKPGIMTTADKAVQKVNKFVGDLAHDVGVLGTGGNLAPVPQKAAEKVSEFFVGSDLEGVATIIMLSAGLGVLGKLGHGVASDIVGLLRGGTDPAAAVAQAIKGYQLPDHLVVQIRQAAEEAQKALPGGEAKALPGKSKTPIAMAPGTKPTERTGRPMWEQPAAQGAKPTASGMTVETWVDDFLKGKAHTPQHEQFYAKNADEIESALGADAPQGTFGERDGYMAFDPEGNPKWIGGAQTAWEAARGVEHGHMSFDANGNPTWVEGYKTKRPTPEPTVQGTAEVAAQPKEPWQVKQGDWLEQEHAATIAELRRQLDQGDLVADKPQTFGGKARSEAEQRLFVEDAIKRLESRSGYWFEEKAQLHKSEVEQALKDGKPVPAEVLADYPDLAKKYGTPEPTVQGTAEVAGAPHRYRLTQRPTGASTTPDIPGRVLIPGTNNLNAQGLVDYGMVEYPRPLTGEELHQFSLVPDIPGISTPTIRKMVGSVYSVSPEHAARMATKEWDNAVIDDLRTRLNDFDGYRAKMEKGIRLTEDEQNAYRKLWESFDKGNSSLISEYRKAVEIADANARMVGTPVRERGTNDSGLVGRKNPGGVLDARRGADTGNPSAQDFSSVAIPDQTGEQRGVAGQSVDNGQPSVGSQERDKVRRGGEGVSAGTPSPVEPTPPVSNPESVSPTTPPSATRHADTAEASPGYGDSNKLVSKDRYEQAKKRLLGGEASSGIDPDKLAAMAEIGVYHLEAGTRAFAEWAGKMVDDLGESVREHLPQLWRDSHREMGIREPLETPSTVAHADVDRLREQLGLPERKARGKADADLQTEAMGLKDQAEAIASRVNNALLKYTPTDAEQLAMGMRLEELKKDLDAASKSGDAGAWDAAWAKASNIADALDKAGSETGAALRARQFLLENQMDEFSITRRMERAKGSELDAVERQQAREMASEDAANKAAVEEARKAEEEAVAEGVLKNERETPTESMPKGKSIEAIRARREWAAKAIREELAKAAASPVSMILGAGGGGGIAPDVLKFRIALREYAYTLVDEGLVHLEDVVKRIVNDFPGLDRDKVISELAAPTRDATTRTEAAMKKAALIREAKQIVKGAKPKGVVDQAAKRQANLEKRIAELQGMKDRGEKLVKVKGKQVEVSEVIKDLEKQKKALETELTPVEVREEPRMAAIQKELDELDRRFATNDFRKKTKKEVQMSQARRQAEEKLKQRRAQYNQVIRDMEPKTWAQKFENATSNLQLISPQGRIKDILSNTGKVVGETGQSQIRLGVMKRLEHLGDGSWHAMGVNPKNGFADLFDETYVEAVVRRRNDTMRGGDAAMNAKYGNIEGLGHKMAGVSDVPFSELYRRAFLADWAGAEAKAAGFKGDKALMKDLIANAPEKVLDEAEEWSRRMTFNNFNSAAIAKRMMDGAFQQIRKADWAEGVMPIVELVNAGANLVTRYGKVIGNVATNMVRTSPAGFGEALMRYAIAAKKARRGIPMSRQEAMMISDAFAKGTVGTVGFAVGYAAYKNGVNLPFMGREMQSKDKSGNDTNNYWWDNGNAKQIATGLPMAMMMGYEMAWRTGERGPDKGEDIGSAFANMLASTVLDQPLVAGANRLNEDIDKNGVSQAMLSILLSRIIPGGLTETANEIDSVDYYKNLPGPSQKPWWYGLAYDRPTKVNKEGTINRAIGEAMRRIPGLRGYLPTGARTTGK